MDSHEGKAKLDKMVSVYCVSNQGRGLHKPKRPDWVSLNETVSHHQLSPSLPLDHEALLLSPERPR